MRCPDVSWGQQQHLLRMLARRWRYRGNRSGECLKEAVRRISWAEDSRFPSGRCSEAASFSSALIVFLLDHISSQDLKQIFHQPPAPVSSGCSSLFSSQNTNVYITSSKPASVSLLARGEQTLSLTTVKLFSLHLHWQLCFFCLKNNFLIRRHRVSATTAINHLLRSNVQLEPLGPGFHL